MEAIGVDQDWRECHQYKYQNDHSKFQRTQCQQILQYNRTYKKCKLHSINDHFSVCVQRRINCTQCRHIVPPRNQNTGCIKHDVGMVYILTDQHDCKYTSCNGYCRRKCIHKYVPQECMVNLIVIIFLCQKKCRNSHCAGTDQ